MGDRKAPWENNPAAGTGLPAGVKKRRPDAVSSVRPSFTACTLSQVARSFKGYTCGNLWPHVPTRGHTFPHVPARGHTFPHVATCSIRAPWCSIFPILTHKKSGAPVLAPRRSEFHRLPLFPQLVRIRSACFGLAAGPLGAEAVFRIPIAGVALVARTAVRSLSFFLLQVPSDPPLHSSIPPFSLRYHAGSVPRTRSGSSISSINSAFRFVFRT